MTMKTQKPAPLAFSPFGASLYAGQTFETLDAQTGVRYVATIHEDGDMPPPWENADGHGPVSDWRAGSHWYSGLRTAKRPGECVLSRDKGSFRFYDFAEACRIARREQWGLSPEDNAALGSRLRRAPTRREIAAEAARLDFERLKAWCADRWSYLGVTVRAWSGYDALTPEYEFALWGVESDCGEHIHEEANGLLAECAAKVARKVAETEKAERDDARMRAKAAAYDATVRQMRVYDKAMTAAERSPTGDDYERLLSLIVSPAVALDSDSAEMIPHGEA